MIKLYLILGTFLACLNSYADEITLDDINKRVLEMEEKYSIKFHIDLMPTTTWIIDYEFAQEQDYENLFSYLELLDMEFSKYLLSFLKKSKLEAIAIVKNLVLDAYYYDDPRAGIPDYHHELLIFDFTTVSHSKTYKNHVIHHEFYHMLEEQFNGNSKWKDPVWNSFNVNNDVYGGRRSYYLINHPDKGFVSKYSLSSLEEDKAETFSTLFTKEYYKKVRVWIKKDNILFNKVEYIKNFLKGIDRSFSDNYWSILHD
ncbi:MAG: putative zinc-binding metallopeptidase [Proteobacteria bacterium]|nr:putative zinc-binding metallopeptidase [Pseudomonadota bacterium]